jgi:fatty-acyl-CoA synthase
MYDVALRDSYFSAQQDFKVLETTVGGALRDQARNTPEAEALVEIGAAGATGRRWSYGELFSEAERLACALLTRFEPGGRICIWAPNTPEWVIVEYAAALAGLTLVTANPAYQARELRYVLEQSRAVALFHAREHRGNPMSAIAGEVSRAIGAVRELVDLEDHRALFAREGLRVDLPEVRPDDPVQIQYTSGTTGFPKGVVLHHRGLTNNARLFAARAHLEKGSTALNFMPLFHTAGSGMMALGACQSGCRMILEKLFDPPRLLDILEAERVAFTVGVPTMLIGLLEAQAARPRDVSSLKMIVSGGSMVSPELVRRVRDTFGCGFQTVFAQTESSPVLTQTCTSDSIEDLCETVGQALPQTEVSIRDPQTHAVMAVGAMGEICARSYGVMIGYNDDAAATSQAIDSDGWLHTGDLGTMDSRGYVKVTGRVKDMIIRGGENLFPVEIENVLLEHPDIKEVAVVGIPDKRWGETVACFVRLKQGAPLDPPALVAHCRERISAPKTPARWIEVGDWPLTGSGKIQKFVLRERLQAGYYQSADM